MVNGIESSTVLAGLESSKECCPSVRFIPFSSLRSTSDIQRQSKNRREDNHDNHRKKLKSKLFTSCIGIFNNPDKGDNPEKAKNPSEHKPNTGKSGHLFSKYVHKIQVQLLDSVKTIIEVLLSLQRIH
jgi:hypothetical protein